MKVYALMVANALWIGVVVYAVGMLMVDTAERLVRWIRRRRVPQRRAAAPAVRVPPAVQVLDGSRLQAAAEALALVPPRAWRGSPELDAVIEEGNALGLPLDAQFFVVARLVSHPDFRSAQDLIGRA